MKQSKAQKWVISEFKKGRPLTKLEVQNEAQYLNVGDLMFILRNKGYKIKTTMIVRYNSDGEKKRFAKYSMI